MNVIWNVTFSRAIEGNLSKPKFTASRMRHWRRETLSWARLGESNGYFAICCTSRTLKAGASKDAPKMVTKSTIAKASYNASIEVGLSLWSCNQAMCLNPKYNEWAGEILVCLTKMAREVSNFCLRSIWNMRNKRDDRLFKGTELPEKWGFPAWKVGQHLPKSQIQYEQTSCIISSHKEHSIRETIFSFGLSRDPWQKRFESFWGAKYQ